MQSVVLLGALRHASMQQAEADERERGRRRKFEDLRGGDEIGKATCKYHPRAHVRAHARSAEAAHHKPKLERAEAPAEPELPVLIVDNGARLRGVITQVFGGEAERVKQWAPVGHVQRRQVEGHEQLLVRVDAKRVAALEAGETRPNLVEACIGASVRCVDVEPQITRGAHISELVERVEGARGRRATRADHRDGQPVLCEISIDGGGKRFAS